MMAFFTITQLSNKNDSFKERIVLINIIKYETQQDKEKIYYGGYSNKLNIHYRLVEN